MAVSVTNGCEYCIASHTASARKKGMTDEQLAELLAVVGMANQTNALATGYGVPVDDAVRRDEKAALAGRLRAELVRWSGGVRRSASEAPVRRSRRAVHGRRLGAEAAELG